MNFLFLTKGMARYRKDLIESLSEHLPAEVQLAVATNSPKISLWEVDWDQLVAQKTKPLFRDFPVVDLRSIMAAIVHPRRHQSTGKDALTKPRIEDMDLDLVAIQEFSWPMLKVSIYCRLAGVPCVVCTDMGLSSNWGTQFSRKIRLQHASVSWLTDGVVAHTPAAQIPVAARWRPICFVPHTVDIRNLKRSNDAPKKDSNEVRFLMVASFTHTKGHDLLIDAVQELIARGIKNVKFRLVGVNDSAWLEKLVAEKSLQKYFDFLGSLKGERLFDEFRHADAFVLSSRGDTFGVVVHEAAAFGLPMVVSKFAGASSVLIDDKQNGFVIDPFDTEEFANKLEILIRHPDLRQKFGIRSRTLGEEYCANRLGRKLADWLVAHQHQHSRKETHP